METIVYSSPKKYIIIDIENLLNENNIPVSSIQLYITVNTREGRRERRGELTVPIEEFDEQLNDAETLEIYVEEKYHDKSIKLIEEWVSKNFYKYCIYKSYDYDEVDNIQRLLIKNDIPCLENNYQPKPKTETIETYYKKRKRPARKMVKHDRGRAQRVYAFPETLRSKTPTEKTAGDLR